MKTKYNDKYEVTPKRYVDIKSASRYTSLPVSTLYEWSGTGRIPSIKIGRRLLYDLSDIDQLMASLKRASKLCEETVNNIVGGANDSDV